MSLKAQTPREPDTSLPRPHHTSAGRSRGQACTPPTPPGRGGNTARPAKRLNSPGQPGRCLPIQTCVVSTYSTSLAKWPLDPADPKIRDQTHIVHVLCPRRATGTYPQLLNHSVPHDYQVSALIPSCRIGGKRLRHDAASVTTGRVCEKQDSAAFVRYHENSFGTSALLRPR